VPGDVRLIFIECAYHFANRREATRFNISSLIFNWHDHDSGASLAGHYRIRPLVSDAPVKQIGNFEFDHDLRRVEERVLH